jgi:ribosomal protein L37E
MLRRRRIPWATARCLPLRRPYLWVGAWWIAIGLVGLVEGVAWRGRPFVLFPLLSGHWRSVAEICLGLFAGVGGIRWMLTKEADWGSDDATCLHACRRCGFDLRSCTTVRCSECGAWHGMIPARHYSGGGKEAAEVAD